MCAEFANARVISQTMRIELLFTIAILVNLWFIRPLTFQHKMELNRFLHASRDGSFVRLFAPYE